MSNDFLRDRIARKLAVLPDERLYQVLDFVEFLETKYAEPAAASANIFQRFAEGMEDKLRAGRVSASTISETMNLMHKAIGVLDGVTTAGKTVANDIASAATRAAEAAQKAAQGAGQGGGQGPAATRPADGGTGSASTGQQPGAPGAGTPPAPGAPPSSGPGGDRLA